MSDQSTFNPGFPVYIFEENMELPKNGNFFIVSGNGFWMHKDTGIVKGFIPVDNISFLRDLDASAHIECNLPKIPANLVWKIKTFFKNVVAKYHAESEVNLYYNKETKDYKIQVPEQIVSAGSVQYKRSGLIHKEGMENYLRVGTIHSHCDFDAFHSGTDVNDEVDFDGLHCTFGHNDKDEFTISASIVMNGNRLKVDPEEFLEGIEYISSNSDTNSYFALSYVDQNVIEEWNNDLDEWMEQVTGRESCQQTTFCDSQSVNDIIKGDKVVWVGNCDTSSIKSTCGNGPFEVLNVLNGLVTIDTNIGEARFSNKLFKKV